MNDVAVAVADPDLARQVWDVLSTADVSAGTEISAETALLVTDRITGECPVPTVLVAAPAQRSSWEQAGRLGVDQVIELPDGAPLLQRRVRSATSAPPPTGTLVRVVGARGGSGATTLAVGLAVEVAGLGRTVLLDADPWGGGLDTAVGVEAEEGLRWDDLRAMRGAVPMTAITGRLPHVIGIAVLSQRGDRSVAGEAWRPVCDSLLAGGAIVVADVPRYCLGWADRAGGVDILVVPHDVASLTAARRLLDAGLVGPDPVIALRRIRSPLPPAAVRECLPGRPVVELPDCAAVRAGADFGDLAAAVRARPFARGCRRLAREIGVPYAR